MWRGMARKSIIHGFTLVEVMLAMAVGIAGALALETAMSQWLFWEQEQKLARIELNSAFERDDLQSDIARSAVPPQCEK